MEEVKLITNDMSQSTKTLLSFLLGAATGALLGILYAPDKGSNTRDKLSYRLDKYKKMLEEHFSDYYNNYENYIKKS